METTQLQYCRFCGEQKQAPELIDVAQNEQVYNDLVVKLYYINADYVCLNDETLPKTICQFCYQTFDRTHSFLANVKKVQDVLRMIFVENRVKVEAAQQSIDITSRPSTPDSPQMVIDDITSRPSTPDIPQMVIDVVTGRPSTPDIPQTVIDVITSRPSTPNSPQMVIDVLTSRPSTPDSPQMVIDESENEKVLMNEETGVKMAPQTDPAATAVESPVVPIYFLVNPSSVNDSNSEADVKFKVWEKANTFRHINRKVKNWLKYRWLCPHCDETFPSVPFLQTHCSRDHRRRTKYRCTDCKEKITDYDDFAAHVRKHHMNLRLCCDYCNMSFVNNIELKHHRSRHLITLTCKFCHLTFKSYNQLSDHLFSCTKEKLTENSTRRRVAKKRTTVAHFTESRKPTGNAQILQTSGEINSKPLEKQEIQSSLDVTPQNQVSSKPQVQSKPPPGNISVPPALLKEISHLYKSKPATEQAIQVPPTLLEELSFLCKSTPTKDQAKSYSAENQTTQLGNIENQASYEKDENQRVPESSCHEVPVQPFKKQCEPSFSENHMQIMPTPLEVIKPGTDSSLHSDIARSQANGVEHAEENEIAPELSKSQERPLAPNNIQPSPVLLENQPNPVTMNSENGSSNTESEIKTELLENPSELECDETTERPLESAHLMPHWASLKVKDEQPENQTTTVEPQNEEAEMAEQAADAPCDLALAPNLSQSQALTPELPKIQIKILPNSTMTLTSCSKKAEVELTGTPEAMAVNKTHPPKTYPSPIKLNGKAFQPFTHFSHSGLVSDNFLKMSPEALDKLAKSPSGKLAVGIKFLNRDLMPSLKRLLIQAAICPNRRAAGLKELLLKQQQIPPVLYAGSTPQAIRIGENVIPPECQICKLELDDVIGVRVNEIKAIYKEKTWTKFPQSMPVLSSKPKNAGGSIDTGSTETKSSSSKESQETNTVLMKLLQKQATPVDKYCSDCTKDQSTENISKTMPRQNGAKAPVSLLKRKQDQTPCSRERNSKAIKITEEYIRIAVAIQKPQKTRVRSTNVGSPVLSTNVGSPVSSTNVGSPVLSTMQTDRVPTLDEVDASGMMLQNMPIPKGCIKGVAAKCTRVSSSSGTAIDLNGTELLKTNAGNSSTLKDLQVPNETLSSHPLPTKSPNDGANHSVTTKLPTNTTINVVNYSNSIVDQTQKSRNSVNLYSKKCLPKIAPSTETSSQNTTQYEQMIQIPVSRLTPENQAKLFSALPKSPGQTMSLEYLNIPLALVPPHLQPKLKEMLAQTSKPCLPDTSTDIEMAEQLRELEAIGSRESRPKVPLLEQKAVDKSWTGYRWWCGLCEDIFESASDLREHCKKQHTSCFIVRCLDCGQVEQFFRRFVKHVGLHRKFLQEWCPYCNQKVEKASRRNHLGGHKTKCRKCGDITFHNLGELSTHIFEYAKGRSDAAYITTEEGHKADSGATQRVKRPTYQCDKCTVVFSSFRQLSEHMPRHKPVEYICDFCKNSFSERGSVRKHIAWAQRTIQKCRVCDEMVYYACQQNSHSHFGPTKEIFRCELCMKGYFCWKSYCTHLRCVHGKKLVNTENVVVKKKKRVTKRTAPVVSEKLHIPTETDQPAVENLQPSLECVQSALEIDKSLLGTVRTSGEKVQPDQGNVQPTIEAARPALEYVEPPDLRKSQANPEIAQPAIGDVQPSSEKVNSTLGTVQHNLEKVQPALENVQPAVGNVQPNLEKVRPAAENSKIVPFTQRAQPYVINIAPFNLSSPTRVRSKATDH